MNPKVEKWKNKRDLIKLLQYRESNAEAGKILKERSQFTDSLVKRLGLEYELEGHKGCVNCLQWTSDGKHLASGSDDTNVIIWDPFRHKQLQVINTHHIGNIFSVKFLGNNNNIIATAAGDCRVFVQTLQGAAAKNPPLLECFCHINRVKRLATTPDEPTLFWSAGEDGIVMQYDLREQHDCSSPSKLLICLGPQSEVKCVAVNPTKPHYLAVGANDCYIRMYDRRMLKMSYAADANIMGQIPDSNCVQYYAPGHLAMENAAMYNFKLAATDITFNSAGSEMLVNMGGEQIYLFDINNSRHINELQIPKTLPNKDRMTNYKCYCRYSDVSDLLLMRNRDVRYTDDENCACFYMKRAFRCYERRWMGDLYSAARDYLYVTKQWPAHRQAYIGLIKSLIGLKWSNEANQWLEYFCKLYPSYSDCSQVKLLRDGIDDIKSTQDIKAEPKEFVKKMEEAETKLRLDSRDYEKRFLGHCNTTTDIKEANFLGEDGNYICAGSDEGIFFIWERKHSTIVTALVGDVSIVNCIQPHPSACFIASSGIDPVVKLWSPLQEGAANSRLVQDIDTVVETNQQRMSMDPFETMLVNIGALQEVPNCRTS